jgi:hypothetical protein
MNTIGSKMNNKLTNVIGNKFANKFHSMGHKMMPMLNMAPKPMSNIMLSNPRELIKKLTPMLPIAKKMKNRLTK